MKSRETKSDDLIVNRLRSVAQNCPELQVAARLYEVILPIVRDTSIQIDDSKLDQSMIVSCLKKGYPLLSGLDMKVETRLLSNLLYQIVRAVEMLDVNKSESNRWQLWRSSPGVNESRYTSDLLKLKLAAHHIRQALEEGFIDADKILGYAACADHENILEISQHLKLDGGLLWMLARNAVKPALHRCRQEIERSLTDIRWDKGFCFVCGSRATLSELQDNDQVRHLRCGQCGADWYFNRLECFCCGNTNPLTQQTISEDGCDNRRIDVCDVCNGYIKVIAAFSPTPPELLTVEDLATLHLDYIAQQKGYISHSGV